MGFFNSCVDILMRITTYVEVLGGHDQQPLPLPPHVPSTGLTFTPQGASPGFTCQYPNATGWKVCNSPSDRGCWITDPKKKDTIYEYNITTDYETFTPSGVTREYFLNVTLGPVSPDGYIKDVGILFNNTFPGPVLEACWGDTFKVHVTNLNAFEGHTTHWHGLRQFGTNQMDGVNGVTQCPIADKQTYTYEFKVGQYGHTWYHAHYQTTYSDGALAGLTLYGPSSADYDEALHPMFMQDWVHANSSDAFKQELAGGIPVANTLLFDGNGTFVCDDLDPNCCKGCAGVNNKTLCDINPACAKLNPGGGLKSTIFQAGKRYLLRLINSSAEAMFIFSIDDHDLTVVQTDLVPIHPYKTKSIFVGIGQRYEVIVEAKKPENATEANYWIRTRIATGCGTVQQSDERTGILRYNSTSTITPTTAANDQRVLCEDEPAASLVPMVPWTIDSLAQIQGSINNYTFEAGIDFNNSNPLNHGYVRWDLLDNPLYLNYSDPTILHVDTPNFNFGLDYCIVPYDYSAGYVWLIITGHGIPPDPDKRAIPAAHPIHLHGHDFVVLDQSTEQFDLENVANFTLRNPPRRDVALLYSGGYLALAFKPDNPGVWLVHCHIAWHASSGLALQVYERQPDIIGHLGGEGALKPVRQGCESWEKFDLKFDQDDSGI